LPITGNLGFNYAQVTKGGVSTLDIDKLTMQSKLTAGLYVVGELLDVDGDCGGYNLHWAFASAMSAVNDILSNI
jgi:predicted flavoprotein YhiN